MGDAPPPAKAFRQRGLDRSTGATRSSLAIGFEPRTDIAPDLTGVAVAPVAQGGFGVGLEPLVQPIHGGAMQGHSGRAQKVWNRAAVFKCSQDLLFHHTLFL